MWLAVPLTEHTRLKQQILAAGHSIPDGVYYGRKMANPKRSLPNAAIFQKALGQVLRVSKSDLQKMLAEEKRASQGKPKRGPKPKRRQS
jgi:hypothetical protein